MVGGGLGFKDTANQLVHDNAVDFFAFDRVRAHPFQSVRGELFRLDFTLHEPASADQPEASETALDRLIDDNFGDMQPW